MKINKNSEAYCTKHNVVFLNEAVNQCYCRTCEHMIIRKKLYDYKKKDTK